MKKLPRVNECGHPDRIHRARGKCIVCYNKWYKNTITGKEKRKIARKKYKTSLKGKIEEYINNRKYNGHEINYNEVLPWFQILPQNRVCWMCGKGGEKLNLDHDHITLKIRGWTHGNCNRIEGIIRNSPNPKQLLKTLTKIQT